MRVSLDELRSVEGSLKEVSRKMMPKLVRESWYRNAHIRNGYQGFVKEYESVGGSLKKEMEGSRVFVSVKSERSEKKVQFRLKNKLAVKT